MKKIFLFALPLTLSACSQVNSLEPFDNKQAAYVLQQNDTSTPTEQMIKLDLPHNNQWKKIDLSYQNKGAPVILVPTQQNENNWTESIRTKINAYINTPGITAKQVVQADLNQARANCQEATGKILQETNNAIVYQLNFSNCKNEKNQTQIGKAFNGKDAVYVVRYTALSCRVVPADFGAMSQTIKSAQLVPDPRYISRNTQ